ncbi:MAG: cytochrome c maturation protein CcmE [Nitrospinota bacterium]
MNVKQAKFAIAGILIVSAFAYLAISGFQSDNLVYFLTVDEIAAKRPSLGGKGIRVQGKIVPRSLKRNIDAMQIAFQLQGERKTLPVRFRGVPPDLLENGFPVIAEGKLDAQGNLVAKNLMVACPSKFQEMKKAGEDIPTEHTFLIKQAKQDSMKAVKPK